jgi:glycine amidinotransferase
MPVANEHPQVIFKHLFPAARINMRIPVNMSRRSAAKGNLVDAEDEWSPLRAVIVGRAEHSAFPNVPRHLAKGFMPPEYVGEFRPHNPFPADIVAKAQQELDHFAEVLQRYGVTVYRPDEVDWLKHGGYTGAMPRDRLMTVGTTLIESIPAWECRRQEINLAYSTILSALSHPEASEWHVSRQATLTGRDTIFDGKDEATFDPTASKWTINNSRPAFDAADFVRLGKYIIGQLSHVTNAKGVEYLRSVVPEGYTVELIESTNDHALHIDTTLLPLRRGVMVYNPHFVTEKTLRGLRALAGWELHPYPLWPRDHPPGSGRPPAYMTSRWIVMNVLILDEKHVFLEAQATEFADWIRDKFGMEPIMLPFQHVNSIGGSFHCATVDLVRG